MKKRKRKKTNWKKRAWKAFSEYIRRKYADDDGFVSCCTCGRYSHWKQSQASHLIPGRTNGILFDERGVYPACYQCNVLKHGNILSYIDFLEKKHGKRKAWEIINDLKKMARTPFPMVSSDFEDIYNIYKIKLTQLDSGCKTQT